MTQKKYVTLQSPDGRAFVAKNDVQAAAAKKQGFVPAPEKKADEKPKAEEKKAK